ncbi:hypothetical protein [Streptomyces sp. NBC_01236]|uniref:hypothetical protein n=1 Tax=Streptomyces sp. NBC_01236 TaxID=2903789 RepID=UPI002E0F57F9|nr:hypothetical protein OG324_48280 [Streptomyces sp. NBC_01236]
MPKSSTDRATAPESVWLASGRHTGPAPQNVLRDNLRKLKAAGTIQDFLEAENSAASDEHVFEARWLVADAVTVRARLTTDPREHADEERRWTLAAEADRPWDAAWSSPATMFWPEDRDFSWDHDRVEGLRLRDINPLPKEDAALRRLLRDAARHSWSINVVVHEAMTTDDRGRLPLARLLPPGLRHRVVEHRAAPEQFQAVNWALYDVGTRVPRGGAVILPGTPARLGYDEQDFSVRSVFLDGSEPTELLDKVVGYAALPWPLPDEAAEALNALRQDWHLLTLEEELAHARSLVSAYAEALDAMTKSRDLYREATERAHAALAEVKELRGTASSALGTSRRQDGRSPHPLAKTIQRVTDTMRARRTPSDDGESRPDR